jgi:pimeloyl-ACP methyl ester carboxylesterase
MIGSVGLLAAACAFNGVGNYDILSVDVSHPHPSLERVVYQVEFDHKSLNRFAITHVTRRDGLHGRSLLLLSPFALPGAFYEISETEDYAKSAAAELAEAGVDVWLVDQRRTHLAAGSCESGVDCSAIATWDNETVSQDALFALSLLKAYSPWEKPVIGGFSAGSSGALATVNRAPDEFSGLFMYEGTLYNKDPAIAAHNDPICTSLTSEIAAGTFADPSFAAIGESLELAHSDPSGLSPIPGFPPGTTNEQSMFYIFGTPPPPTALSPTATFVRDIVDFTAQKFVYTNEQRLELAGPLFDTYGALPALRDLACGLAGRETKFVTNVGRFRGDLLVFVEGTGFGPAMFDTAALFDHASSVTIDQHTELGDSDPYFAFRWHELFLDPLEAWLRRTR